MRPNSICAPEDHPPNNNPRPQQQQRFAATRAMPPADNPQVGEEVPAPTQPAQQAPVQGGSQPPPFPRIQPGGDRPCFICQQTGHFARECPNRKQASAPHRPQQPPAQVNRLGPMHPLLI